MLHKARAAIATLAFFAGATHAQTLLLDETSTIVAPAAPSAVLRDFEVFTAGSYELTVTDFAVPAALGAERAAVLRDGVIVRQLELGDNPSVAASFDATPGVYTLSVVGTPGTSGVGTIGARVRRGTDSPVLELTETISAANPPPPASHQTLEATFAVANAGDYRVSLVDLGFPAPLSSSSPPQLTVLSVGGTSLPVRLTAAGIATFTATPGNYRLFATADADPAAGAGIFFTSVSPAAGGSPIYQKTVPVGRVEQLGAGLLTAGGYSLVATDLNIPAPLATLKLAVISEGQLVSRLDAPGEVNFAALAAGHDLFGAAAPASGGAGSYATELRRGTTSVLSFVNTASDGAASGAITLTGNVTVAGAYRLRLTDFSFPQGFSGLRATVTQAGASVASLATPGTLDVNLQPGAVKVLVFAQPNTSANGVYGIALSPVTGTGAMVIEATRGVGAAFAARQFSVTTAGRYQVTADDLEFPQRFAGLDAVITRGPDVVGSFFGGGSFIFSATPGSYFINFIARPGLQSGGAGTFRMRVAQAANLPTVTLTAEPTHVGVGGTTRISWNSSDATQCVATGAWAGSKASTGNETTAALSSQATFNLECTGPGGVSNAQLVVSVSAPSGNSGGGGGGGALSEILLLGMLAAAALRALNAPARSLRRY